MGFEVRGIEALTAQSLKRALYTEGDTIRIDGYADVSQYDELLAMQPLPVGRVVLLALDGVGFHGQMGRVWQARPGNIHLCAKLETMGAMSAEKLSASQFVAPLAMAHVAERVVTGEVCLKWVNDLMIEGRKAGGVLTHYRRVGERKCFFWGIGLNVCHAPVCEQETTCLKVHLNQEHVALDAVDEGRFALYLKVLCELWRTLNEVFERYDEDWAETEKAYRKMLMM